VSVKQLLAPASMIWLGFAAFASNQYHTLVLETQHHFSAVAIGTTIAIGALSQMILPWVLLWLSHRIHKTENLLRISYLTLAISLISFPHLQQSALVIAGYFIIVASISSSATLQSISIITQARPLGDGWVLWLRSMGTFGFAASSLFSSLLAHWLGITGLYYLFAFWAFVAAASSFGMTAPFPQDREPWSLQKTWSALKDRNTLFLLGGIALANLAITAGTSVISNFIHGEIGGSHAQVSLAWTIATFAEMPLIWGSILLMRKFGLKGLLLSGIVSSFIRMTLLWKVDSIGSLYAIQILHGLFFGATLSGVGIWLAQRYGAARMRSLQLVSQSFYTGLSGVLGGQMAGMVWEAYGLRSVYLWASILLLTSIGIILIGFKPNKSDIAV